MSFWASKSGKETKTASANFERTVLPHLPRAYNLARWLTNSDSDAEDVAQDACLRAFQYFAGFRGEDARAWLLAIVRNTAYTHLQKAKSSALGRQVPLDDLFDDPQCTFPGPEREILASADAAQVRAAIESLPPEFREVVVLRDMDEFSYREIAEITGCPIGTVMSRLNRARKRLRVILTNSLQEHTSTP